MRKFIFLLVVVFSLGGVVTSCNKNMSPVDKRKKKLEKKKKKNPFDCPKIDCD